VEIVFAWDLQFHCIYACGRSVNNVVLVFRSSPRRWPSRFKLRCVRTSTKSFSDFHLIWCVGTVDLDHICAPVWPRPELRSRSRSRSFQSCEKCTFLGLSPPPFRCGAQNWWLVAIVWDLDYRLSEPNFWISIYESYHESSNFVQYQYLTKFKWPYFGSAW